MTTGAARTAAPPPAPAIRIDLRLGRLTVSGPARALVSMLPGAAHNDRRQWYELSLTMETLRSIRRAARMDKETFARHCAPAVLTWARTAGRSEQVVNDLHARLSTGWRVELPWRDRRGGLPAPAQAPEAQSYTDAEGVKRWKHREPFDHQKVMATAAVVLDGCGFLCEMGTGKTRAAIEAAAEKYRRGEIDNILVVCPNGVVGTWERELLTWTDVFTPHVLDGEQGTMRERAARLEHHAGRGSAFILNYEALGRKSGKGDAAKAEIREAAVALARRTKLGLVLDEGHKIKNPQAQTTQAAMEVARMVRWRLLMTGTPILGGAEDIWSQWYVVDLGVTFGANFVQFKREFFQPENPWTHERAPLDGTLDEIGIRLRRRGLRYRKEDCLTLPPKLYETIGCQMTREQTKAYNEMRDQLIAELRRDEEEGQVATASTQLVALLRLTQITSGFVPTADGGHYFFDRSPKADALEEIIREQLRDRKAIVWARYRLDIERLAERFQDLRPGILYGGMTREERADAEARFQDGDGRLLIAHPGTGGTGLQLSAASLAAYYSQDYRLDHRLQSEDRCHRSGSEIHASVTYLDLVCTGTIDEDVSAAIAGKKDVAEVVVDLKRRLGIE